MNIFFPKHATGQSTFLQNHFVSAQSHSCTLDFNSSLFRHKVYDRIWCVRVDFGAISVL